MTDYNIQTLLNNCEHYKNCYKQQYAIIEEMKKTNLLMIEAKEKQAQTIKEQDEVIKNLTYANDMLSQGQLELYATNNDLENRILDLEQQILDRRYFENYPQQEPKKRGCSKELDKLSDFNKAPPTKRNKK